MTVQPGHALAKLKRGGLWHCITIVLLILPLGLTQAQGVCQVGACVSAGPRLASFDTSRGALSNALFSALLGNNVSLDVLDWNALAAGEVGLVSYLDALQLELGVSGTSQVLDADLDLLQLVTVMADVAEADGKLAAAEALRAVRPSVAGLSGKVQLGDLLELNFPDGALSDIGINVLSLLTGMVQLYNYQNVLTTPAPITLSASTLGLEGVLNNISLYAQVVEPPIYTCGDEGTQFYSAAVRLKLNLDLVALELDTTPLAAAIQAALGLPNVSTTVEASLTQTQLYVAVARAEGVIQTVDALSRAVTLQATPGVADLFLGEISDAVFFNRTRQLAPATDLQPAVLGKLSVSARQTLPAATLADAEVDILGKAYARGEAPFADTLTFTPPYPQSQTASTSATFATVLLDDLVGNLELTLRGSLGTLLDPLVNSIILPTLKPLVATTLTPPLSSLLAGLVDPLLETLGVRVGEVDLTVFGATVTCSVAGSIYNDLDEDGLKGTDEGWLGGAEVFVHLVKDGVVIASTPVDRSTGQFYLPDLPAGDCSLLLATSPSAASPQAPEGFGFLTPASGSLDLELTSTATAVPDFGLRPLTASFLLITERVRNVTAGETVFVTDNWGQPGDVLEYCIRYVNPGVESVSEVAIQTFAPDHTEVEYSVTDYDNKALKLITPDGLTQFLSAPAGDDSGELINDAVRVRLAEVQSQAFGRVCYRVKIK